MTTRTPSSHDQDAQTNDQDRDPEAVLDRTGTKKNAYSISILTVSQSYSGSNVSSQDPVVHYRVQDDNPTLLLKADNLLKCLKREFGLTGVERYEGEALELMIEPVNMPNGLSSAQKSGNKITCTIVEDDSISLMPVIEEFLQQANSEL